MKFRTRLWKRSNKSFATTIPHIALLSMDEDKNYDVVWEYNEKLKRWTIVLNEKENKSKHKFSNKKIKQRVKKKNEK